jgi:hypothetical protein
LLTRYWFKFKKSAEPSNLNLGCGITAYDLEDAYHFLREIIFPDFGVRPIESVIEDVNISTLEANHVRPNMGIPVVRGVGFREFDQWRTAKQILNTYVSDSNKVLSCSAVRAQVNSKSIAAARRPRSPAAARSR